VRAAAGLHRVVRGEMRPVAGGAQGMGLRRVLRANKRKRLMRGIRCSTS
jgi:hypothetical protein